MHKVELFPKNWREEELFNNEVDRILSTNKGQLTLVFRKFVKVKRSAFMSGVLEMLTGRGPQDASEEAADGDDGETAKVLPTLPLPDMRINRDPEIETPEEQILKYGITREQAV